MPNAGALVHAPLVALSHPILRNFEAFSRDSRNVRDLCECLARNSGVAGAPVILDFYIARGLVPADMRDMLLALWAKNETVVEEIRTGLLEAFLSVRSGGPYLAALWVQDTSAPGVRVFSHKRPEAVWLMILSPPVPVPTVLRKTYVAEYLSELRALSEYLEAHLLSISQGRSDP